MVVLLDKVLRRCDGAPGTLYLHADHLGSVDAVTGEAGSVEERRSYDAFGQRRNPVWGDPPPAVFLGEPDKPPILPIRVVEQTNDDGSMDVLLIYPPRTCGAGTVSSSVGRSNGVGPPEDEAWLLSSRRAHQRKPAHVVHAVHLPPAPDHPDRRTSRFQRCASMAFT